MPCHQSVDHLGELRRDVGGNEPQGVGVVVEALMEVAVGRAGGLGQVPAGEALEQHHPEGVEVCGGAAWLARPLLRRHVSTGPAGLPAFPHERPSAGQPEVDHHRRAVRDHQDVLGLQVAVENAQNMDSGQVLQQPTDRGGDVFPRPPLGSEERLALDPGHHHDVVVALRTIIEQRDHTGKVQSPQGGALSPNVVAALW